MIVYHRARTLFLTVAAMVAFAANSVLARIALLGGTIDAASFSTIRLAAGAGTLLVITAGASKGASLRQEDSSFGGSWGSAAMLFLYAASFSFAYLKLSTGTGALILFGLVQVTMMAGALLSGERPTRIQWSGLILAVVGLFYLMLPGVEAPPLWSAALMTLAGISWGVYSLWGRGARSPLAQTKGNFTRSVPLVILLSLLMLPDLHIEAEGVLLALGSGALASGLGYVVWYGALQGLTATNAAVVQLSVPVLAAGGGVVFLSEVITSRLALSAVMTLGGIALAVLGGGRPTRGPVRLQRATQEPPRSSSGPR